MTHNEDGVQPILDGLGREYAQQVARALALGVEPDQRYTYSLIDQAQWIAEDIGMALLTMDPPRRLSLGERLRLAQAALHEGGWVEREAPSSDPITSLEGPMGSSQVVHILCASSLFPGYYTLDSSTGRPLVKGDPIELDVGGGQFVSAVIRKIDQTHYACLEGKPPIPLAIGLRLRLRETALTEAFIPD